MLFWQPPSCFSQWSPSSLVVDDVTYSCAKQFMMAENARLFQDRRAGGLIMSSPDPCAPKRIGRGVSNFDCAVLDCVREDAVHSGTSAKFAQNPATKQHLLNTVTKRLAEAESFEPVEGHRSPGRRLRG